MIGLDVSGNVVTDFTYDPFTFPTAIAFDKQNNHLIVSEHGGIGEDHDEADHHPFLAWYI